MQSPKEEANLILLEVRLDGQVLSDGVGAYEIGRHVFLPLGELARMLTLAVRVTDEDRASGYILREDRNFSLDVPAGAVHTGGKREELERSQVKVEAEDIYVDSALAAGRPRYRHGQPDPQGAPARAVAAAGAPGAAPARQAAG
jgi:hypothetical protein